MSTRSPQEDRALPRVGAALARMPRSSAEFPLEGIEMIRITRAAVVACASILSLSILNGCSRSDGREPQTSGPRYGALMMEIGRRFELLGEAAVAGRWELAEFELHELEEVFDELAQAAQPEESRDVDLHGIREAFLETHPVELRDALERRDAAAFAEAFERAALTCNGCHKASSHAFVEIPTRPGERVPKLDPLPAAGVSASVP